jgi:hypothetical protein
MNRGLKCPTSIWEAQMCKLISFLLTTMLPTIRLEEESTFYKINLLML